jgi:hypothetical protein
MTENNDVSTQASPLGQGTRVSSAPPERMSEASSSRREETTPSAVATESDSPRELGPPALVADEAIVEAANVPLPRPAAAGWVWRPPDPRLPWPRSGPWRKNPDGVSTAHEFSDGGRLVAASVRGRGHKHDALHCDDAHGFVDVAGWRVVIASDGAGSAPFSRVGAQKACDTVRASLEQDLTEADLSAHTLHEADLTDLQRNPERDPVLQRACNAFSHAFARAHRAIVEWVSDQNTPANASGEARDWLEVTYRGTDKAAGRVDPHDQAAPLRMLEKDCNCTLLVIAFGIVTLVKRDGDRRQMGLTLSCSVGDGMTVVFRRPGLANSVLPLMAPDAGAFSGQTQFLDAKTTSDTEFRARRRLLFVGAASDVVAIAAMTDGVADDYFDGQAGMARLYCDLILNGALRVPIEGASSALQPSLDALRALVAHEVALEPTQDGAPLRRVPVKYVERYLSAAALTAEALLAAPEQLHPLLAIEPCLAPPEEVAAQAERLLAWLDAYVVRGSYDDRTLVIYERPAKSSEAVP